MIHTRRRCPWQALVLLVLFVPALVWGQAQLPECQGVFPGGLQSHRHNGQVWFDWNAQLVNNPTAEIHVARVHDERWSMLSSCGGEACTASQQASTALTPTMPPFAGTLHQQVGYQQHQILDGESDYRRIDAGSNSRVHLKAQPDGYRIKELELHYGAQLTLEAGDYWIDHLALAPQSRIEVAGEGTARVYVKHSVTFPHGASANYDAAGSPLSPGRLFLYSNNHIHLQSQARVSALVYARNHLNLQQAELYGRASFHQARLGPSARVKTWTDGFSDADVSAICLSGDPLPEDEDPAPDLPPTTPPLGNACQAAWPNGLQVHSPEGSIRFDYNAQLHTPSQTGLFSPQVHVQTSSPQRSCGDEHCDALGTPVAALAAGPFQVSPASDLIQLPWQGQMTLGDDGNQDFGTVHLAAASALTFVEQAQPYRIKGLHLGYDSRVYLAPGDYWVDTLTLEANAQVQVIGAGSVRLFVRAPLILPWQAALNPTTEDPAQLILYAYGDLRLETASSAQGLIYALGDVALHYHAHVTGGLTARNIHLHTDSHVTYASDAVRVADYGHLCPDEDPQDTTPPELTLDAVESPTHDHTITLTGTVIDPEEPGSGVGSVEASTDSQQRSATLDGDRFSVTLPLVEGENRITVTATDLSGNSTEQVLVVTRVQADETPPELSLHNTDGQEVNDPQVLITGTVIDPEQPGSGVASVLVYSDRYPDTSFAAHLQVPAFDVEVPLAVGDNQLQVVATDLAGNQTDIFLTVRRLSPPRLAALSPADGAVIQTAQVTLTGAIETEQNQADLRLAVNDGHVTPVADGPGRFRFEVAGLPLRIGQNRLVVRVESPDGNAEQVINLSHIPEDAADLPAPELTLLEPLDGSLMSDESFRLRGQVSSHAGAASVSVNGQPVTHSGGYFNRLVSFSPDQDHLRVTLEATDGLGKTTQLEADYYRDTQAPQIALDGLSPLPAHNAVAVSPYPVSGTVSDNNLASVTLNGQPIGLRPGDQEDEYRFSFAVPLAPGQSADLRLVARDLGGNRTVAEYRLFSEATAEISPLLPGADTELLGRGEPINLQVAARISPLEGARVRVVGGGAQAELEVAGSLANGTLTLPDSEGEQLLTYQLLDSQDQVLASTSRVVRIVSETAIPLALQRHEPANNARHIAPNQAVELYFNRAIDPASVSVTVRETLHGETYINQDPAGIDFLNAQGFQLHRVQREREPVPGALSALPGNQALAFYPERHFGYNARIYVDVTQGDEDLGRFTFQVRPLPTFIVGSVRDQFGQPLTGIQVTLPELDRETRTNNDGSFSFGFQERPGNDIPPGRHRLVINPGFAAPDFGTQTQQINVQQGRRNSLDIVHLTALNPDVPFHSVSSFGSPAVLAGGDLRLDLEDTRLVFENGRSDGRLQAQFLPFEQLHTRTVPGAIPYWMFALQPRGVEVEGSPGVSLQVPALFGGYDYLAPSTGYVVMLGYDPQSEVIRPVGVGYLENRRVSSVGELDLTRLDYLGFAQVDPRLQGELEAFAEGQRTLQQLQTLLQQQSAAQP